MTENTPTLPPSLRRYIDLAWLGLQVRIALLADRAMTEWRRDQAARERNRAARRGL